MKKIFLSVLLFGSLYAADNDLYNNSIILTGGYAINPAQSQLDNNFQWGLKYNMNRSTVDGSLSVDAIQLAINYSPNNTFQDSSKGIKNGNTALWRVGINALWYIENDSDYTPYIIAGAGVQAFSDTSAWDNNNPLFATAGAGVEYQLRGDVSVGVELKDIYAGTKNNYVTGEIGIKYSFGQSY